MKKILLLIVGFMFVFLTSNAQSFDWLWAKSAGSTGDDFGYSIVTDSAGNIYMAGYFKSPSIIFGNDTLINAGDQDALLVKFDPTGNAIWAKSAGGAWIDKAFTVAVDASGDIYWGGYFGSTSITFDTITLSLGGNNDPFLVKLDPNGNVKWVRSAGGADNNNDQFYSVDLDKMGNVYVAGFFVSQTINFGGSATLTNVANNYADMFIAKYDSNGDNLWAKSAGGSIEDAAVITTVDTAGNVFVGGRFSSPSITFDTIVLTNAGQYADIFLAKYDTDGNLLWARGATTIGSTDDQLLSIVADKAGNIYATGLFKSTTITFDSITLTAASTNGDVFTAKFDKDGNVVWAKRFGGVSFEIVGGIALDTSEYVYISGHFQSSSISFGSSVINMAGQSDVYVAKYDSSGNEVCAVSAGGTGFDLGYTLTSDEFGNIFVSGGFSSATCDFGNNTIVNSSSSKNDIYLAKLVTNIYTQTDQADISDHVTIFPNPTNDLISIISSEHGLIELLDVNGQIIRSIDCSNKLTTIDMTDFCSGIYCVKLTTNKVVLFKKIIKI